jgi:hypothetical protein
VILCHTPFADTFAVYFKEVFVLYMFVALHANGKPGKLSLLSCFVSVKICDWIVGIKHRSSPRSDSISVCTGNVHGVKHIRRHFATRSAHLTSYNAFVKFLYRPIQKTFESRRDGFVQYVSYAGEHYKRTPYQKNLIYRVI